jgi:hypothetical protein
VPADSPGFIQNGAPPTDVRSRYASSRFSPTATIPSPATADSADRTSASAKSCATMRARRAPRAVRTAISPVRMTVRA